MAGIYIYSDKPEVSAEITAFAKSVGKKAVILTTQRAEADLLVKSGADKIYVLQGVTDIIENYGKAIAELLREEEAELFVVGSTVRGREVAANVAGYLDCAMISNIRSIKTNGDRYLTTRMIYGGSVVETEELTGLSVITVQPALFDCIVSDTAADIEEKSLEVSDRIQVVGTEAIVKEGVDLKKAERIVSVGLGLNKQEDLPMIYDLADAMGAEVGCSRSVAEEKKWLPESQYVGITGVQVKPMIYLACGISGQAQHLFGIKDSKIIVGINTDEHAPIFRACDYGIVGDMYEVIPLLTAALKNI